MKSKTGKVLITMSLIAAILTAVFFTGRYGWKLAGFRACQGAGIESVEVSEDSVRITGFYPGSFPKGFCGYYAREKDGVLYVGFRFSAVFGFFETGDFDVSIPVREPVHTVIMKTRMNESPVWQSETGFIPQTEPYGVFVRIDRSDIRSITMSYDRRSSEITDPAAEPGSCIFIENDIMLLTKETGKPVPFSLSVCLQDGSVFSRTDLYFEAEKERMIFAVTAGGELKEDSQ